MKNFNVIARSLSTDMKKLIEEIIYQMARRAVEISTTIDKPNKKTPIDIATIQSDEFQTELKALIELFDEKYYSAIKGILDSDSYDSVDSIDIPEDFSEESYNALVLLSYILTNQKETKEKRLINFKSLINNVMKTTKITKKELEQFLKSE